MKAKYILTFIVFLSFILIVEAKKVEGTIIRRGEMKKVVFNNPFKFLSSLPNYESLQHRVVYFDETGKRMVVKPDDAEEVRFVYKGIETRMISVINSVETDIFSNSARIFLKLEMDGPRVRLYRFFVTNSSPGVMSAGPGGGMTMGTNHTYQLQSYIHQKGNDTIKRPKGLTFKKDMTEYFSDCPSLATLLDKREFRKADMEAIVKYYNEKCE